uniref:MMS19 nucleotide excision repair protein n=1 Tax=Cacopsylla melanoneura TaxID=428564 RepID=A0A8D8S2B1_9HEMI
MSASKLEDLFKSIETDDTVDSSLYDELKQGLISRSYNILEIVENLGILLVNKESALRKRGTEILSKVLGMLDKTQLNERELEFLLAFYCDRLKDHHSIVPDILLGFYNLSDMKHLPQDGYIKMFPAIFLNFNCQSQLILDRKLFYEILFKCMQHNLDGLKPMGPDFVYGVIQSIDGERDPRNLIFLFTTLVPLFLKNFEMYHLNEEMFDIMACYFPVDFRPKENDPDAISREDLSNALMPNLTAKPSFAEFAIPLALEKLESDLKVAKVDSLKLLTSSCYKFPVEKITESSKKIWNVAKNDSNAGDSDVRKGVVELLHALLTVLPDDEASGLFQVIYNHVKYSISTNIDKVLFVSNTNMLITISKDSKVCMKQVAILLIPILYNEINKTYNDEYIQILNEILEICSNNLDIRLSELTELSIAWNDLIELYFKLCSTSDCCLCGLNSLHSYLDLEQRKSMYSILYDGIKTNRESKEFQACLCTFAKHYQEEIVENVIFPLKNEIVDQNKNKNEVQVDNIQNKILEDLKQNDQTVYTKDEADSEFMKPLAYRRDEAGEEVPIFVAICPPARQTPVEELFIKNLYCPLISLESYLKDLSSDVIEYCLSQTSNDSCFRFCYQDCATNITYLKLIVDKYEEKYDVLSYFEKKFNVCQNVIKIFLKNVGNEAYSISFVLDCISILNTILSAFNKQDVSNKISVIQKVIVLSREILEEDINDVKLIILIPLLNNVDFTTDEQQIKDFQTQIEHFSSTILDTAISTQDPFINKYTSILLAIILNTVGDLNSNESVLNTNSLQSKLLSLPYNENVNTLHAYITKSLIMKGHTNIESMLQILVDNLKSYQEGKRVIESLKILIREDTVREDHFEFKNVRFLYRQRLFSFCLNNLLKNVSSTTKLQTDGDKNKIVKLNNYLAILIQLKHLPNQIIIAHVKTLLPIMIECLTLICDTQLDKKGTNGINETSPDMIEEDNPDTNTELDTYYDTHNFDEELQNLLGLFVEFLKSKMEILHEYVNSFVDKFLYIAQNHSSLNLRIAALQCLHYLSDLNIVVLMPFKNKVLEGLKLVLDDKKRLVRKQVVVTIDKWYILDSVEDSN